MFFFYVAALLPPRIRLIQIVVLRLHQDILQDGEQFRMWDNNSLFRCYKYIFCGQNGIEKYMKFTMFKKETYTFLGKKFFMPKRKGM